MAGLRRTGAAGRRPAGAVVAEFLARAGVAPHYDSLGESERGALLEHELAGLHPLRSPHLKYSPLIECELGVVTAAAHARGRLGAATVSKYVIAHCESA